MPERLAARRRSRPRCRGPSSIFSRSRVSGTLPGRRSATSAFTRMKPIGMWSVGRRDAEHALEPLPELVPRHRVRAAELERPVRRRVEVDRAREVLGDVVDPDRLDPLRAGADDRRHRREPRELAERRQDAAVAREDEARPEDHVVEPGAAAPSAPSPTWRRSRGRGPSSPRSSPSALISTKRPDARGLRGRDEVARSLDHDRARTPRACPAGSRRGGRRSRLRRPRGAGSRRRSCRPRRARSPSSRAGAPRRSSRARTRQRTGRSRARSAWTTLGPTKPVPPVTRIIDAVPRSSSSSDSASGRAAPGTSSRARRCRTGAAAGSVSWTKESCPIFIP